MSKNMSIVLATSAWITVALLSSGCCCGLVKPVGVGITEIGTCRVYNEADGTPQDVTDTFPPDAERIVLYFYLKTSTDVTLTYHWYHDGVLVYTHLASQN